MWNFEIITRYIKARVSVAGAALLADKPHVLIFFGVFFRAEEEHMLQIVCHTPNIFWILFKLNGA